MRYEKVTAGRRQKKSRRIAAILTRPFETAALNFRAAVLEELSFLADALHRPEGAPAGGWPTKREEIDFHFTQAVRNALKIASLSGTTEHPFTAEDIGRIIGGGHKGYLEYRANRRS